MSAILNARARIQPAIGRRSETRLTRADGGAAKGRGSSIARARASRSPMPRYALKSEIMRAVQAVRASGIPIVSIDLRPDGTIRLSSAAAIDPANETEFDRWDKAGKL